MANVVFMPFHWAASLNATFALARRLRARGHRVLYLGIPDVAERIERQGLDFLPPRRPKIAEEGLRAPVCPSQKDKSLLVCPLCHWGATMTHVKLDKSADALQAGMTFWDTAVPVVPCLERRPC